MYSNVADAILAQRRFYSLAGQYRGGLLNRLRRSLTKFHSKKKGGNFVLLHQPNGVWLCPDHEDNIQYPDTTNHNLY